MPVTWSATGTGVNINNQNANSLLTLSASWSHTALAGDYVLAFVNVCQNQNGGITDTSMTATYGGVAMTRLGTITANNGNYNRTAVFALAGVAAGTATISTSATSSTAGYFLTSMTGQSVSYGGVLSASITTASNQTTGLVSSASVNHPDGMSVLCVSQSANTAGAFTAPTHTTRSNQGPANANDSAMIIEDCFAGGNTVMSVTAPYGTWFGFINVKMIPTPTPPTGTVMKSVWNGVAPSISGAGPFYSNVNNPISNAWQSFEQYSGGGEAGTYISDAVVITKVTVYLAAAPGAGKSWAFKIRNNLVDSAAVVTISDTNTSASWSGSVTINQLNWLSVSLTGTGTPAATGIHHWTIEYSSVGSPYYLLPGFQGSNQTQPCYGSPLSGYTPYSGTPTDYEAVVPAPLTVTRIAGGHVVTNGGTQGFLYSVRKNNTTDSQTVGVVGALAGIAGTVNMSFAAGDMMVVKRINVDDPAWIAAHYCLTIVPSVIGEVWNGFGNPSQLQQSATNYEGTGVGGNATWNATESNVYVRLAAGILKNLYARLVSATGSASKTRTFTLRSNLVDTAVSTALTNTAVGQNTVNTAVHGDGNFFSIKMVPSGTPNTTAGAKVSWIQVIPQPTPAGQPFFAMF